LTFEIIIIFLIQIKLKKEEVKEACVFVYLFSFINFNK
jgi:hypothetical protein